MQITDYHAKYYAHELTKRCSSDNLEKLAPSLMDAQVDLNPHQVDAALFAFKSPLSKGAILADEVGLGKTIEAGIVLTQKWAERKRKILIITPSHLRKQWSQELQEKFFLPSQILEAKSYNQCIKEGKHNPFDQNEIVICSFQFARNKEEDIRAINWDTVVIDEAHRLRNVYKPTNKIARSIKRALADSPKLLLTATPLQNSLMELYGLVSFIDEYTFGDIKSFRNQFARLLSDADFYELRSRLRPVCARTLRRQVLEYVKFTNRIPITQEFTLTQEEQALYDMVSEYLRRDNLQALPVSQRSLMILVLRKLLSSSTFAIAGALNTLVNKLKAKLKEAEAEIDVEAELSDDFEDFDELADEWSDDETEGGELLPQGLDALRLEIADLEAFRDLAESITHNAKGQALLLALKAGFKKAEALGADKKAIIFTESRRTQEYLVKLLAETEYENQLVLFNGSNNDERSKEIFKAWMEKHKGTDKVSGSRTADMRSALVDYFRNHAQIMIATEAGAEGINLQFCSLVVNYDLPWNPQRIEQRIGRCHRYGQKHDVVVVNFLNKNNAADQRVYQLLSEKFALFSGVFGSSDEVLGSIESGVDFEKRIMKIYQECRTREEIQLSFDELQKELEIEIDEAMKVTRKKLLENFDEEVHEKLRVNLRESEIYLNKYENWLWEITKHYLKPFAEFINGQAAFRLHDNPLEHNGIPLGLYKMGRNIEDAHIYRIGHPLAQGIVSQAIEKQLPSADIIFNYTQHPVKISILEPLVGKSGCLSVSKVSIESLQVEDYIVSAGLIEDGTILDEEQAQRIFSLPGEVISESTTIYAQEKLDQIFERQKLEIIDNIAVRNAKFFDEEIDKVDKWADDLKAGLEFELKELDKEIKCLKTEAKKIVKLEDKLEAQRVIKELEKKRNAKRRSLYEAQDEVDQKKEELIAGVEGRLKQTISIEELFTIKWQII